MPTTGAVTTGDYATYASPFSHADETSTPGYYRVGLAKYGINAEMTATDRTGWQRYTFPTGTAHNVLFNTGQANMPVLDSDIRVIGDHTLEGKVHDGGFCAGHDQHTVYFTAEFDKPFSSYGTWAGSTLSSGARDAANGSGNKGAWVSFGSSAAQVTLKVGLSYTGLGGARANLRAETGSGYDFDATRAALKARWNKQLSLATVAGGTHDRQVAYYTSLYHSMLHPNLAGDVDGSYNGFDNKIHRATDYTPRQNFSLWDTYRTQNQLLELLAPRVARDDALSLLAIGREGGWLPRWALANSETNIMTGDPVTPTLVELWSKGFLAGHEDEAYALLKKNATAPAPADSQYNGRAGVTTGGPASRSTTSSATSPTDSRSGRTALTTGVTTTAPTRRRRRSSTQPPTRRCRPWPPGSGTAATRNSSLRAASGTATSGTSASSSSGPGWLMVNSSRRTTRSAVTTPSTRVARTSTPGWCRRTRPGWFRCWAAAPPARSGSTTSSPTPT